MNAWSEAKTILSGRLRTRAEYWRRKAKTVSSSHARKYLVRADEADACADVASALVSSYAAPEYPDMASTKKAAQ